MRLLAVCVVLLLACPAANAGWISRTDLGVPEYDLREVINLCAKELFEQKSEFELFKSTPPESILFDFWSDKSIAMPELLLPHVGAPVNPAVIEADLPVFTLSSMLKEEEKKPLAAFPNYYSGGDYAAPSNGNSDSDILLVFTVLAAGSAVMLWILAAKQR